MNPVSVTICLRCGALAEQPCKNCEGVEYDVDQAYELLNRALLAAMYGEHHSDPWSEIWHDVEVFCRVASSVRGRP